MKTKNILFSAIAICFMLVALSSCKNKKQATQSPDIVAVPPAPPAPPATPDYSDIPPPPPQEVARVIEYRRTPCFGTCPIFNFKVYEGGLAMYEGKNFVDMIGNYEAQVSKEQIAEIVAVAKSIGFFEMKEVYDNDGVTDLPSVYVSVASDKGLKQVKSRYQGPKELKTLTEKMDVLIKELDWKLMSNENKD